MRGVNILGWKHLMAFTPSTRYCPVCHSPSFTIPQLSSTSFEQIGEGFNFGGSRACRREHFSYLHKIQCCKIRKHKISVYDCIICVLVHRLVSNSNGCSFITCKSTCLSRMSLEMGLEMSIASIDGCVCLKNVDIFNCNMTRTGSIILWLGRKLGYDQLF